MDKGFSLRGQDEANEKNDASANNDFLAVVVIDDDKTANGNGNKDKDSPDSGSLYSDEIPSGYNSGEQYDTLSTGYMSGEAYELPDTRMEIHEPALDVIEECLQPLGAREADSDGNIFVLPTAIVGGNVGAVGKCEAEVERQSSSSSETSDQMDAGTFRNVPVIGDEVTRSPNYGSIKSKLRKKVTTFAIPIDNAPLNGTDDAEDFGFDPESSDAAAPTGGYRTVPSDTDTSAFDSDANAITRANDSGNGGALDSGTELLQHASIRAKSKGDRIAQRKAKKSRRHDEEWFNANDSKVWVAVRQFCFWFSIAAMIASSVAAAVLLYLMPRNCDPMIRWYEGSVFLDIRPDATSRPFLDLKQHATRLKVNSQSILTSSIEFFTKASFLFLRLTTISE